tara:strand:+ start:422 stop:673 length:252 start_codon:yes stop_codon:yes gene_type:complete
MFYPSSQSAAIIRRAVQFGVLKTEPFVLSEGQRLDLVSANFYGDAQYWWVIAAASGIGWQCQVPAGTYLRIPSSLSEVRGLVA